MASKIKLPEEFPIFPSPHSRSRDVTFVVKFAQAKSLHIKLLTMQKIERGEFQNILAIFQSVRQWLREIARHYHICMENQSLRMLLKVCSESCLYRSHREKNLTKNSGFEQKDGVNERTLRNHNCKRFAHTVTGRLTLGAAMIGEESIVKRFSFKSFHF